MRGWSCTIDSSDLMRAKPEYVQRLARWLGMQDVEGYHRSRLARVVALRLSDRTAPRHEGGYRGSK